MLLGPRLARRRWRPTTFLARWLTVIGGTETHTRPPLEQPRLHTAVHGRDVDSLSVTPPLLPFMRVQSVPLVCGRNGGELLSPFSETPKNLTKSAFLHHHHFAVVERRPVCVCTELKWPFHSHRHQLVLLATTTTTTARIQSSSSSRPARWSRCSMQCSTTTSQLGQLVVSERASRRASPPSALRQLNGWTCSGCCCRCP